MIYMRLTILLTVWTCILQKGSSRSLPGELRGKGSLTGNYSSGYVITTPRKWLSGGSAQVCVFLTDAQSVAIGGGITISLNTNLDQGFDGCFGPGCRPPPIDDPQLENAKNKDLITPKIITLEPGMRELCEDVSVPRVDDYRLNMKVEGTLGNFNVTYNKPVTIGKELHRIFVQTDKFLYKPGQKVQFRILSVTGPFLEVSNILYDKIWIESPSGSRVAQWLNKDNSERLIHLEFQLADEPEEGSYKIHVQQGQKRADKTFHVEDFVLSRYQVSIKPPKYILGTDEKFYFTVCAKYTYGAPVKGDLELMLDNNGYDKYNMIITKSSPINGCKDVEVTSEEMKVNFEEYYVYNIKAEATVVEEGTGVRLKGDPVTVRVSRQAIIFTRKGKEYYMKPALPFTMKVKAEFPDGLPAANETMNVCYGDTCKIFNTDAEGLLTFVLLPKSQSDMQVTAVNYPEIKSDESNWRSIMYESSYSSYAYGKLFYSASNSSLIIRPPLDELSCTGETSNIILPIMFAAFNQTKANLHIQVISRGQIQFTKSEEVEFVSGNLPVEYDSLLGELKPPHPGAIKGLLNIKLQLPPTASPKAKIIVWYERDDREIVADTQEVDIEKCLINDVRLSWSNPKVQPGEQATLTLSAEPNSICSLGIVDKSVEVLSANEDDLTVDRVFEMVESAMIYEYENGQVNDHEYCEKKALLPVDFSGPPPTIPEFPSEEPSAPILEKVDGLVLDDMEPDLVIRTGAETIITKRSSPPQFRSYYSEYYDALKMFDVSGLYILTELTVETRPCKHRENQPCEEPLVVIPERVQQSCTHTYLLASFETFHGGQGRALSAGQVFGGGAGPTEDTARNDDNPRSYFPETWLWNINFLASGKNQQQLTLPDTITEWAGKAVCVHPQQGLGISPRAAITTFTPFFVDLTLPPTVKRGEILPVKISVFNYEDQDLPVRTILESSDEYEIITEGRQWGSVRSSCVASQDKTVHTIMIRPIAAGDVNITVAATVDETFPQVCGNKNVKKSDTIIKTIKVELEGFPREKTWTKYICTNDIQENSDSLEQWQVEVPSDQAIVADSARGWVTAVGDLLGPTLENLGSLVRMPYGCGEQNMLNFAPNIFILKYLDASDQTSNEIAEKATNFMRKGYQRELKYRHKDGSFSAFGERDVSGSTWLTAFVLKSFAQATHYIQVDEKDLQMSTEWLKLRQQDNGCFESVGKVFNKGMKGGIGGSGSAVPLTAYVLISLLESGEPGSGKVIREAANCLQADRSRDSYTQALKAYALSLGNLPEAQSAVNTLISLANEDISSMSWEGANTPGGSRSIAVETGGYAILAMMTLDVEKYKVQARKVVKWISSQRNGQGGFISTQDTVVALQAMASFEATQDQGPVDLTVTLQTQTLGIYPFTINEANKLLQQMVLLPSIPINLSLELAGTGCALLQAVLHYNVPEPEPSDAFYMRVSTFTEPDRQCKTKRIEACASYLHPDGQSNMAVIEVKLISGYVPEKSDLKDIMSNSSGLTNCAPPGCKVPGCDRLGCGHRDGGLRGDVHPGGGGFIGDGLIKRYEVDGNLVTFYVDEISHAYTCVSFRVTREIDVEDAKPGTVQVYDYYQNEFSVNEIYNLPPNDECLSVPPLINRLPSLLGF